MNKIRTSLAIMGQSLVLIRRHPKLAVFPLLNLAGVVALLAFFFLPLVLETTVMDFGQDLRAYNEAIQHNRDPATREISPPVSFGKMTVGDGQFHMPVGLIAGQYLLTMFLMTFINVAFYEEIIQAFNGNRVSFARGFALAMQRLKAILLWSLLAGVIGLIIRKIEENVGVVGRWIMALIGFTWSVASVFAIPVIVRDRDQANPVTTLKTSAGMIKRTWGEGLTGVLSISIVTMGLLVLTLALSILLTMIFGRPAFMALTGVAMAVLVFLGRVVHHIFMCGLYVYASEGVAPAVYDPALMEQGWRVRKKK